MCWAPMSGTGPLPLTEMWEVLLWFSAGKNVKKGQLHPICPAHIGWVGPAGDAAELAVSAASRHCLLFAGLSFGLLSPHGHE